MTTPQEAVDATGRKVLPVGEPAPTRRDYSQASDQELIRRGQQRYHWGDPRKSLPVSPLADELARRYAKLLDL